MKHAWVLSWVALGLVLAARLAMAQDVLVIVNHEVNAEEISASDLSDLYSGAKSSFDDGIKALPVLLKNGPVHEAFLNAYIHKTDSALRAMWRGLVFSGQAAMPKTVDSEAAAVEFVASTPGAIGYIGKGVSHEKVKVLTVK